ncbi:MAG: LysR family transcriptional regulator [Paracoccaceae bacterium]
MDRLPAFSGLTAFYAAARAGSLTAAAAELNVSQPAVSRRIAALESDLGCALFDRSHKPVKMTQQGRDLLRALRGGFGQIESAIAQIRQSALGQVVTVTAPVGFVAFWLIPRLGELEDAFPDVTIRIISQEYGEASRPGDVAIRFGLLEEAAEQRLLGDMVYPVASPLYLDRLDMTGQSYDFARLTLLTMERARSHWHDWPSWFESVGYKVPTRSRVVDFSSYAMLVNAALAGRGVCLCWDGVLDDFLATGALVRLEGPSAVSQRGYFMSARDGHAASRAVQGIVDWIAAQGQK